MEVKINGKRYIPTNDLIVKDMPKLYSPFVKDENNNVTDQIAEGYEWVFQDENVLAVEKIDGTNVSIIMQGKQIIGLYNREQQKSFDTLDNNRFIEGVRITAEKKRLPKQDGQHFGELMGPKVQTNFLQLQTHEWFPFHYLKSRFFYKSWGRYPKDFKTISNWFKNDLFSLTYVKYYGEKKQPEGIVFHHPDGRMAKLRLDMFDWWKGKRHKEV